MRKPLQEITDPNAIKQFLSNHKYLFLSVIDGDTPYTVPLNYGFAFDEDGVLSFYFHTSVGGRLYDIIQRGGAKDIKVSFGIAELRGILKSMLGVCEWDADYNSILGSGILNTVTEPEKRDADLRIIMGCFGAKSGYDFVPARMAAVTVYELKVNDYHMKRSKQEVTGSDPEIM